MGCDQVDDGCQGNINPPDPGAVYRDDPDIGDTEILYRMVTTQGVARDSGSLRVTSVAFQDQSPKRLENSVYPAVAASVFLASVLLSKNKRPSDLVKCWGPGYGVVSITAGSAREVNQGIVRAPTENNPAHAMIFAITGPKKSKGDRTRLAERAEIVIPPPAHSESS